MRPKRKALSIAYILIIWLLTLISLFTRYISQQLKRGSLLVSGGSNMVKSMVFRCVGVDGSSAPMAIIFRGDGEGGSKYPSA